MSEQIGLIGGGGQADEVEACFDGRVIFRAASAQYATDGIVDIAHPGHDQVETPVVAAVGAPGLRRQLVQEWPGTHYATVRAASADVDASAMVGQGTVISKNTVITTNVKIGEHSIVNVAASIQHDSTVGDYSTIGPGVRIGGHVQIGKGVFLGIGVIIANDVTIADGVVIGAGSVVLPHTVLDVENGVYVGVPAKLKKANEDWLYEI